MSDMDALRRYYVAQKLLEAISGGGSGEASSYSPPPSAPSAPSRRGKVDRSADSYSFPSG